MIKFFSEIDAKDVHTCWGKGASLWEMTQAGLPVPEWFVLTTKAFWLSSDKRENQVLEAFDQLDCQFVAVRSSWTKEDGELDSFAGQFETYLFVKRENLVEQIIACHNSINSERIVSYCESKNIDRKEIKVAVVVQKMVNSEVAGVCFTANPVSWSRDEVMIEAWYGVGEAVVSGMITPDNYLINKKTGSIQKTVSEQAKKLVLDPEKWWVKEIFISSQEAHLQKLSDEYIIELADFAKKIESHYWKPMDIEWAVEGEKLYILQARPITTLKEDLSCDLFEMFIKSIDQKKLYPPLTTSSIFVQTCTSLYQPYVKKYFQDNKPMNVLTLHYLGKTWTYLDSVKLESLSEEMFYKFLTKKISKESFFIEFDHYKNKIDLAYKKGSYKRIKSLSDSDLEDFMKEVIANFLELDAMSLFSLVVDQSFLEKHFSLYTQGKVLASDFYTKSSEVPIISFDKKQYRDFLLTIATESTKSEMYEKLQYIGTSYSKYLFLDEIETFLSQKYGNIALDSQPSLALQTEEEELKTLQQNYHDWYLTLNEDEQLLASFIFTAIECRDERKIPIQKAFCILSRCLEVFFTRKNIDVKYLWNITFEEILKGKEYLESIKDNLEKRELGCVFFANYGEEKLEIEEGKEAFDKVFKEMQELYHLKDKIQILVGTSASPWKIIGKVRCVQFIEDADCFQDWEVLITGMTRPEYIPLMKNASAIITDEWGITCHAAIVSRELKKPCIIGTRVATQVLKDGDFVEVDADNGIISVLEHSSQDISNQQENESFKKMLGKAFLLTSRLSPIQRDYITWVNVLNNPFYSMEFLLSIPEPWTKNTCFFLPEQSFDAYCKAVAKEFLTPWFFKIYLEREKAWYQQFDAIYHKVYDDFSKSDIVIDEKVLSNLNACFEYSQDLESYYHFILVIWAFEKEVLPEFESQLKDYFQQDFEKNNIILTSQTQLTNEQKFRIELATLKVKYGSQIPKQKLESLQNKWRYLWMYSPTDIGHTYEKILEMYHNINIEKTLAIKEDIEKNHSSFSSLLQQYPDQERLREIMMLINYNVYFRTIRMEKIMQCYPLLTPMYDYLMRALSFSIEEIGNLMPHEILLFLEKGVCPPKRDRHPWVLFLSNEIRELTKEEVEISQLVLFKQEQLSELSGTVAFKGKVVGQVKIIHTENDLWKVQEWDVLVSWFTRPEYIPAMEKASAFITNDGGITCHAAIIARELKKPCIIGTKVATQVLKDGDLVEVDADNGIVKILSSENKKV